MHPSVSELLPLQATPPYFGSEQVLVLVLVILPQFILGQLDHTLQADQFPLTEKYFFKRCHPFVMELMYILYQDTYFHMYYVRFWHFSKAQL